MANEGFSSEDFERLKKTMTDIADLQDRINSGAGDYQEHIKDVQAAFRELKNLQQSIANAERIAKKTRSTLNRKLSQSKTLSEKKKFLVSSEGKELRKQLKIHKDISKTLKKEEKTLSDMTHEMAEQVNSANSLNSSFQSIGRGVNLVYRTLVDTGKQMLNQMKNVRMTELSMGMLGDEAKEFANQIESTSLITNQLGVDTSELAKMQGVYSENIGRATQLTEKGLIAMSELAKGTILGAEGAASMTAEMDKFAISVTGTRDLVEEMLDTAHKMGVNAAKVTKTLQKSLKLAQRYHFKDGVKGLTRMAASAAALKLDLQGISGLADKVFRPEGAVEMASKLQVMGGEFAKLANPFELMFKARNDFEGFAKDIGQATKEFTQFNEETGEFDISGVMLDRMREISQITGIATDKLQEMGVQAKKADMIASEMSVGFDEEDRMMVANLAEFNKETGQWEINTKGFQGAVKDLKKSTLQQIKQEKRTLEERAKQAQTFDEKWENIVNTFKATLLPFLEAVDGALSPALNDFNNWMQRTKFPQKLADFAKSAGKLTGFAKSAGKLAASMIEWVAENPKLTAALVGFGAGVKVVFEGLKWVAYGMMLGRGFNMVASVGGAGGPMMGGRKMLGRLGMGVGLGLGSMGLDYWRGNLSDPEGGLGKGLGVGSSAMTGAAFGSMLGVPGMLVGGLLGAAHGAMSEFGGYDALGDMLSGPKSTSTRGFDDFIMRPNSDAVPFNEGDTIIGMKDGGPIEKSFSEDNMGKATKDGEIKVNFGELKINGTIRIEGEGGTAELPLDDPIFARELSNLIQLELRKSIGGGKVNPNPKT